MNEHPISGLMSTTMQNIKEMVDVNTIVGEPITTPDGTVIIPVSKVTFGFASGGSEFCTKNSSQNSNAPFGGGSGAGISLVPIAFLVVGEGTVKLLQIPGSTSTVDKVVELVPDLVDKISALFKKDKDE